MAFIEKAAVKKAGLGQRKERRKKGKGIGIQKRINTCFDSSPPKTLNSQWKEEEERNKASFGKRKKAAAAAWLAD